METTTLKMDIYCAQTEELYALLTNFHAKTKKKQHGNIESLYMILVQELQNDYNNTFYPMYQLGTDIVNYGGKNLVVAEVLRNIQVAISFFKNPPTILSINWDELPDLLTEEDMIQITGWSAATLATKRSRNEIPYTDKPIIAYPKEDLKKYFEMHKHLPMAMRTEEFDDKAHSMVRKK